MKNSIVFKTLIIGFVLFLLTYIFYNIFIFYNEQKYIDDNKQKDIDFCSLRNDDFLLNLPEGCDCYEKMYTYLIPSILTNNVKANGKEIDFLVLYPNYIVPKIALEKSDLMFGYGVWEDIDAEEQFVKKYNKHAYSFDCGVSDFKVTDKRCHFESSCIGTDEFILKDENQISSGNIHTFGQKLKELGLEDKKVFIKMDITGAETEVLPEILEYSDNVTGMTVVFYLVDSNSIIKTIDLLSKLKENFVIVARSSSWFSDLAHRKTTKYTIGELSNLLCLSFINKNIIDSYSIKLNQDDILITEKYLKNNKRYVSLFPIKTLFKQDFEFSNYKISGSIILIEKIKEIKRKLCIK